MGSSSGGEGDSTIRYAPYIESKHQSFLNRSERFGEKIRDNNPYKDYVDLDFNDAFYGDGYVMSSFPSLYDMYGKFMAGLDIEVLWDQVLNDVQHSSTIQAAVIAHRDLLDENLTGIILPRFKEGMQDVNAVMTSSFIKGKANLERGNQYKIAEFDANLRYKLIPVAAEVFTKHLAWNQTMIATYINVMRFGILAKMDTDTTNYGFALKDIMWDFTVLEQERANIGALQGAVSSQAGGEPSTTQKVLGGVVGGAAAGSAISPGIGTVVGGVLGGLAGLL